MLYRISLLLLAVLFCVKLNAQELTCKQMHAQNKKGELSFVKSTAERSDSLDVLHYDLSLDVTDPSGVFIKGEATATVVAKVNEVSHVLFELLLLTVDSVKVNENEVSFNYNDSLLTIYLNDTINALDTISITTYYQGEPHRDPSGWGGWYGSSTYAYNLGVGFQDVPHSYGRIWYPCFDNFVERASYTFNVLTAQNKKAYCSGNLIGFSNQGGDTILSQWDLPQTIPSYLTSVAVGDYTHVDLNYNSMLGEDIPMWIACLSDDSLNVVNAFQNLGNAMTFFEEAYGPYRWDRVGFALVPFNGGAMEHATNIAFPRSAGTALNTSNQRLMAHELAHHWWGDLVTCQDPKEMWINEGWASFSEFIFLEGLNDYEVYKSAVKENHTDVVQSAHLADGGFLTINQIPSDYTYGDHSYNKGADLAHTLRGYLGDSLFFTAITSALQNHQFEDMSSEEFRDYLNEVDGVDVSDFFEDWIFNPGFPHFSVDSFQTVPVGGNYEIEVTVSQKLRAAPHLYNNVPIEISCMNENKEWFHHPVVFSGSFQHFNFELPFDPVLVTMDYHNKISHAITYDSLTITSPGNVNLNAAKFYLTVDEVDENSFLRIEQHWVGPSVRNDEDYVVNKTRYWKFDGILNEGTVFGGRFNFDGRPNAGSHLDDSLYQYIGGDVDENNLRLLYRSGPGEKWQAFENQNLNVMGNATNFVGMITVDSLRLGEYTFGFALSDVGIWNENRIGWNAFPNPTDGIIHFDIQLNESVDLEVLDLHGRVVYGINTFTGKSLDISFLNPGLYFIQLRGEEVYQVKSILLR